MPEKPELPVRIIRERGSQRRRTYSHEAKVRKEVDRPSQVAASKEVISHRVNEQSRGQTEHLQRRIAFRQVVTEESLRRRRIASREQAGERFAGNVLQSSGARPAAVTATSGIIRVFVVIFLLSMLFLIVSRGQQTGTAIQKVGFFLNNFTSGQPLFKTTKASA